MRLPNDLISRQRARFSSRRSVNKRATSPGSSTLWGRRARLDTRADGQGCSHRLLSLGSGSRALRFIASSKSGRPRRNFGWENSQVWEEEVVRWARGVYDHPRKKRIYPNKRNRHSKAAQEIGHVIMIKMGNERCS